MSVLLLLAACELWVDWSDRDGASETAAPECHSDEGGPYHADLDRDGHGDPEVELEGCSEDVPTANVGDDCDDDDPDVHPGAVELCNGADDDCDGEADDGLATETWYRDADGDGYGNPGSAVVACSEPDQRHVTNDDDCDDGRPATHPGASEVCNGVDDDCDGTADDGVTTAYYRDADGDGFGDPDGRTYACAAPSGYVTDRTDCDDGSAGVHPGASDTCNGLDDDCDGSTDEGLSTSNYYYDGDSDGYGAGTATVACKSPGSKYVTTSGDCNDGSASIHPGASETCDGVDQDCDGSKDEGLATTAFYRDADGDGYGTGSATVACKAPGSGYAGKAGDCNDGNASVSPGRAEVAMNGIDDDCDGQVNEGFYVLQGMLCGLDLNGSYKGCKGATTSPKSGCPSGYQQVHVTGNGGDDHFYTCVVSSAATCDNATNPCDWSKVPKYLACGIRHNSRSTGSSTCGGRTVGSGTCPSGTTYSLIGDFGGSAGTGVEVCTVTTSAAGGLSAASQGQVVDFEHTQNRNAWSYSTLNAGAQSCPSGWTLVGPRDWGTSGGNGLVACVKN